MAKQQKSTAEKRREMAQRPDTDPYVVLEVARDADKAAIKKAYRKKANLHHPDRNKGDEDAERRFKEVAEAYDVLSDPEKRDLFDLYGNVGPEPAPKKSAPSSSESYEERYRAWRSQPSRPRRHMDDWERVYVGEFNGAPHYHFGPVTTCFGCGLGMQGVVQSTNFSAAALGDGSSELPSGMSDGLKSAMGK